MRLRCSWRSGARFPRLSMPRMPSSASPRTNIACAIYSRGYNILRSDRAPLVNSLSSGYSIASMFPPAPIAAMAYRTGRRSKAEKSPHAKVVTQTPRFLCPGGYRQAPHSCLLIRQGALRHLTCGSGALFIPGKNKLPPAPTRRRYDLRTPMNAHELYDTAEAFRFCRDLPNWIKLASSGRWTDTNGPKS